MEKIRHRAKRRNSFPLPLLAWAEARDRRPHPRAARVLARRFGLPLATAATVAELAGIGQGGER